MAKLLSSLMQVLVVFSACDWRHSGGWFYFKLLIKDVLISISSCDILVILYCTGYRVHLFVCLNILSKFFKTYMMAHLCAFVGTLSILLGVFSLDLMWFLSWFSPNSRFGKSQPLSFWLPKIFQDSFSRAKKWVQELQKQGMCSLITLIDLWFCL